MTSQPPPTKTLTYYHAGPLFTVADLTSNVALANLIDSISLKASQAAEQGDGGSSSRWHFKPVLPQDLEPRSLHPHSIRDTDLRALLTSDLALFTYDGAELDAGTVVEYIVAKVADIPSVILRTDFRGGGDQHQIQASSTEGVPEETKDSWNLMSSFWPRTKNVVVDSMSVYKTGLTSNPNSSSSSFTAAEALQQHTATQIISAMESVIRLPPRLPPHLREGVYEWLSLMVGWRDDDEGDGEGRKEVTGEMRKVLGGKVERGML